MYEPNSEHLFAQLDTIEIDNYATREMARARSIEELINDPDSNNDELTVLTVTDMCNEAISEMDADCPHMNEPVLVTGTLKRAYFDEMTQKFAIEDVRFEREKLISFGYSILEFGTKIEGVSVKKVGNLFLLEQMPPKNDGPALVDYVPRLFGFAPVGEVEIEYEMDDLSNTSDLEAKIPDVMAEIDGLIANAEDESAAVLALADHTISKEHDIPDDTLSGLLSYVNNRLQLDKTMPYRVQIDGIAYKPGEELIYLLYQHVNNKNALIVAPGQLILRPYPEIVDGKELKHTDDLHWCLDVAVLGRESSDEISYISIPVKNLVTMQAVRDILYSN